MNESSDHSFQKAPVGIIAGGGGLIVELLAALDQRGQDYRVVAIKGEARPKIADDRLQEFAWGEIGRIINFLEGQGCKQLLLIGHVSKRPDFLSIISDPGTVVRVPKILAAMRGGDDTLLRRVIKLIEAEGFDVISLADLVPDFLASTGTLTHKTLSQHQLGDVIIARQIISDIGRHDIGQAFVIDDGRVLAVEAAEGTDAMLGRIEELRKSGRYNRRAGSGLLIKAAKPSQDMRVDLPTVGVDTVDAVLRAGLSGMVIEAGRVICANRAEMIERANKNKLIISGFSMDGASSQ